MSVVSGIIDVVGNKQEKINEKSFRMCLTFISNFGKIEYQQKLVLEK
jgi:uncharacterized protein YkvS